MQLLQEKNKKQVKKVARRPATQHVCSEGPTRRQSPDYPHKELNKVVAGDHAANAPTLFERHKNRLESGKK